MKKQTSIIIDELNFESYFNKDSSIDEIFQGISNSNFDSKKLKDFINENINFFTSTNFKTKLIDKGSKLTKNNDMIMIIFLITFIDSLNNQNKITKNIQKELYSTALKVDKILQLNEKQKRIIKEYIKKDEEREILGKKIILYKNLLKKQSDNIKQNILNIQNLNNKNEQYKKLGVQLNLLIKEGLNLNILIKDSNNQNKLKYSALAISAVKEQNKYIENFLLREIALPETNFVIKAGNLVYIEPFNLKTIEDSDKELKFNNEKLIKELEYSLNLKKEMMDKIYDLEKENKNLEKENKNLKKENKNLEKENKNLKETVVIFKGKSILT